MSRARGLQTAALVAAVGLTGCATRHSLSDVNTLFLIADRSRDGLVSRSEFIGYSIAEAFRRTDTQRDGVLTLGEFTAVGGSQSTFRAADRSGAGRVTVNDAQRTPVLQQQMVVYFVRADTSRDNYLNKPEFVVHHGKPPVWMR